MNYKYLIIIYIIIFTAQHVLPQSQQSIQELHSNLSGQGLIQTIGFDQYSEYIDSSLIEELGLFNHLAELIDIGFSPQDINLNFDFYRPFYFSVFIHRLKNISRNTIPFEYNGFEYEIPESITIYLENKPVNINIDLDQDYFLNGGLITCAVILNQINAHLSSSKSPYRFILFKARNKFNPVIFGNSYESILNYRIALVPNEVIVYLNTNSLVRLSGLLDLKILQTTSNAVPTSPWGFRLESINEIIDTSQMIYSQDVNWEIKSNVIRQFMHIIEKCRLEYDSLTFSYSKEPTSDQIILKTQEPLLCPEDNIQTYLTISIHFNDVVCTSTHKIGALRNMLGSVDMFFINDFSFKTGQNKLIVLAIQDDYWSIELAKSLYEIHPNKSNNPLIPSHLYFFKSSFYSVGFRPFFCISNDDLRLIKLGHVDFEGPDNLRKQLNLQ